MTIEVAAVSRALAILDAFKATESALTLGELARRTRMHKTTVLRIARTMATSRYLMQCADGSWRLGPAAGWLGARYQMMFDRVAAIELILYLRVSGLAFCSPGLAWTHVPTTQAGI